MASQNNKPEYLRVKQIIGNSSNDGLVPVSRSTWWAGVKSGRYPQPVKLGPRVTAWRLSDIQDLLDNGIEE